MEERAKQVGKRLKAGIRLMGLALTAMLAASCAAPETVTWAKAQGKMAYTKVNIWIPSDGRIPSVNYHQGNLLPVGSRVKILGAEGDTIDFITEAGENCHLLLQTKYTRMSLSELYARCFTEEDVLAPGGWFDRFSPEEQEHITAGTVASGMSKEAVLAAYGYPPSHKTPTLELDTWTYWLSPSRRTVLTFRDGHLADVDGKVTARTVRLYVVSDPSGAVVEMNGQYQGRTPCVVPVLLDPEKVEQPRTLRVVPTEPDFPRLGLLCGMPAQVSVLGPLITVAEVLPTSAAQRLGLQPGDRIAAINGKLVRSEQECYDIVKGIGFGGAIHVLVHRGSSEIRLQGKLDEPIKGDFHPRERRLTAAEIAGLHRKVLNFDLRTNDSGAVVPPAAPPARAGISGTAAVPVVPPARQEPPPLPISGTGFAVGKGGYVLTCAHILSGAREASVRGPDDTWHAATVVKTDVINDWCLLKVPTLSVAPIPPAPDEGMAKGGTIYGAGYPVHEAAKRHLAAPVIKGGTLVEMAGIEGDRRHLQVMLTAWEGFSGAPILDGEGRWLGLVSERIDSAIQAIAPRSRLAASTRFGLKAISIRSSLPGDVELAASPKADMVKNLGAEEVLGRVKSAIVMIRAKNP